VAFFFFYFFFSRRICSISALATFLLELRVAVGVGRTSTPTSDKCEMVGGSPFLWVLVSSGRVRCNIYFEGVLNFTEWAIRASAILQYACRKDMDASFFFPSQEHGVISKSKSLA
jgi:hypothetical protein